jgi:RNA polymerase sigma-70 factor (family 1)
VEALNIHNESELLRRIAAGDEKAYTEVYQTFFPSLVSFIIKIVKIRQVAEDIANEIFLNLWQRREKLDSIQSLNAYLFTAARNRSINALKAIVRSQSAMNQVRQSFQPRSIDAETNLLGKEYVSFIKEQIAELPPKAKQVFTLCREEGLSYEQVAFKLGISRNAVKGHMVASIKKLRTAVEKQLGISFTLFCFYLILS